MTAATVAQPTGTQFAVLLAMFLLIAFLYGAILWQREGVIDRHDDDLSYHDRQIAWLNYRMEGLLKALGLDIPEPVEDDSPEAMAEADDADTEEFPALPATEPMALAVDPTPAVQARRDAAWDEQRHELMSPETAEKQRLARAAFVEQQLAKFDFSGRSK